MAENIMNLDIDTQTVTDGVREASQAMDGLKNKVLTLGTAIKNAFAGIGLGGFSNYVVKRFPLSTACILKFIQCPMVKFCIHSVFKRQFHSLWKRIQQSRQIVKCN